VEEGAAAGGLSKPHYSVDLSTIELQPLIQRVECASSNNSKKIESIDSRFDGMDSKFNGVDSRFDGLDAKLAGILQALKVQTASPTQQLQPPSNYS
jgi:hypothetical protein